MQDLASLFVISERQVQRLTAQGVLKLARNSKGQTIRARYVLGDAVAGYVKHLRQSIADDPDAARYQRARSRRMEALAQLELLRLKQARGALLSRHAYLMAG